MIVTIRRTDRPRKRHGNGKRLEVDVKLPPGWEQVGDEFWKTHDDAALSVRVVRGDFGTRFIPEVHWKSDAKIEGPRRSTLFAAACEADEVYARGTPS